MSGSVTLRRGSPEVNDLQGAHCAPAVEFWRDEPPSGMAAGMWSKRESCRSLTRSRQYSLVWVEYDLSCARWGADTKRRFRSIGKHSCQQDCFCSDQRIHRDCSDQVLWSIFLQDDSAH